MGGEVHVRPWDRTRSGVLRRCPRRPCWHLPLEQHSARGWDGGEQRAWLLQGQLLRDSHLEPVTGEGGGGWILVVLELDCVPLRHQPAEHESVARGGHCPREQVPQALLGHPVSLDPRRELFGVAEKSDQSHLSTFIQLISVSYLETVQLKYSPEGLQNIFSIILPIILSMDMYIPLHPALPTSGRSPSTTSATSSAKNKCPSSHKYLPPHAETHPHLPGRVVPVLLADVLALPRHLPTALRSLPHHGAPTEETYTQGHP